jgi:hypothetical protein
MFFFVVHSLNCDQASLSPSIEYVTRCGGLRNGPKLDLFLTVSGLQPSITPGWFGHGTFCVAESIRSEERGGGWKTWSSL